MHAYYGCIYYYYYVIPIEAAVQFLIIIIPFPFNVMHGSAGRFIIIYSLIQAIPYHKFFRVYYYDSDNIMVRI